jgi:hypothetical protein
MTNTRGQRLRAARSKKFRSARSAALALAIPVSTYGSHERAQLPGGRDFGPEEAQRYAQRFGVTPEWLLTGYETMDEKANVPALPTGSSAPKIRIVGYIGADAQAHLYAVAPRDLEEVELSTLAATKSTVALEIRGDSLGEYYSRWLLVYDEVHQPATPERIGKTCVVGLKDGRVFVKQLQQGAASRRYDLNSPSAPPIRNVAIAWAAIVKGIIQR